MDLKIENRSTVIMGASSRVGLARAKILAAKGVNLMLSDKDQAGLDAEKAEVGEFV